MSASNTTTDFEAIAWEDSKLLDVLIQHDETDEFEHTVELRCLLLTGRGANEMVHGILRVRGCRAIRLDIDLLGKASCSNDIASASCRQGTRQWVELVEQTKARFDISPEKGQFDNLYAFDINLVPPGGRVVILAREFELISSVSSKVIA